MMNKYNYDVQSCDYRNQEFKVYKQIPALRFIQKYLNIPVLDTIVSLIIVSLISFTIALIVSSVFPSSVETPGTVGSMIAGSLLIITIISFVSSIVLAILILLYKAFHIEKLIEPKLIKSFSVYPGTLGYEDELVKIANHKATQEDFLSVLNIANTIEQEEVRVILDKIIDHYDRVFSEESIVNKKLAQETAEGIKMKYDILKEMDSY